MRVVGDGSEGAAAATFASGVALLHQQDQVFTAMLTGWRNQQTRPAAGVSTVEARERMVRAFAAHSQSYPWRWSAQLVDEWMTDMRAVRGVRASTLRGYQIALRLFCPYATDRAYGWPEECQQRFGSHPVQVVHEWNSAVHVQDAESDPDRRVFTRAELQAYLDHADEQVAVAPASGRKGWLPAFRDATIQGRLRLRAAPQRGPDARGRRPFGRNPHAAAFGDYGVCYIRHGKANKGSPPKRRSVLTVWPWTVEVLTEWIEEFWPTFGAVDGALWPTEQAQRLTLSPINHRFAAYRDALDLPPGLDFHSLRRSYVTHLIERGRDALFVQNRVGHGNASTTSIYTCVS
jgi:integrase/recombinase XerC